MQLELKISSSICKWINIEPASSAQAYYQMAHGAASAVIESGRHPLYKGGANLVDNFSEIFYKDVAEHIFVEEYNLVFGKNTHLEWLWNA